MFEFEFAQNIIENVEANKRDERQEFLSAKRCLSLVVS